MITTGAESMTDPNGPRTVFRELSIEDARAFLATQQVGRVAYTFHDRVDIVPMHYMADGDWLYGRTSVGAKLATLAHHPWCAVEVDEIRGMYEWISVVVKGAFHLLSPDGAPDVYQHALALLRVLEPDAFRDDDPFAHRTVVFRIHLGEVTGRSARPA
jgi:nitroimidazol reductase NimA-like FMN-containing flavoprotein (pyridoxamine 5'-phosphate oxidase superfamily)